MMVRALVPLEDSDEFILAARENRELRELLEGNWMWWVTSIEVEGGAWPCLILEGDVRDASRLRPLWKWAKPVLNPNWGRLLDADRNRRIQSGSILAGMWPPDGQALEEATAVLFHGGVRLVWHLPQELEKRM